MTLSIEDLPAPFGPMIARTSCSRTSNDTPCSATTPPNARDTSSTSSSGPPPVLLALISPARSCRFPRVRAAVCLRLQDAQVRGDGADAAILEAHLGLDEAARLARIERIDERRVLLGDVTAAHLARARQLAVVRVQLLVKHEKTPDLRVAQGGVAGEVAVDLLHALADEVANRGLSGEIGVARVRDVAPLGPVADRRHVDIDEGAHLAAPVAEAHRFLDVGEELELVLEVLRREQSAARKAPHVLRPVDDLEVALAVEIPRVSRMEETLGVDRCAR